MSHKNDIAGMLDLMIRPAFSVEDGIITQLNRGASARMIQSGTLVSELLLTGAEEYEALSDGCLYLTLTVANQPCGASVTRLDGFDVFVLEQDVRQPELQAMALAARELREPLSTLMIAADRLLPNLNTEDPAVQQQAAYINQSLHQMLRLIGNMSDAARYTDELVPTLEMQDVSLFLKEIFEKATILAENTGVTLRFSVLSEPSVCPVNAEKLERAVYNLISNAIKFSPAGSTVEAKLTRRGSKLHLTVSDSGSGIPRDLISSVYSRYLRQAGVEDSLHGIGLGMVMIRSAAATHGGTVLIQRANKGTKITLTISTQKRCSDNLRSPRLKVDYAGERDHGLIELSDSLPVSAYHSKKIN